MVTQFLLYIKHHIPHFWTLVERVNALLFYFMHVNSMRRITNNILGNYTLPGFLIRKFQKKDLAQLEILINSQSSTRIEFFRPHSFDLKSLRKIFKNPSFIMMGIFEQNKLVGYFFLRCFWNKKCFVGR